jgi:hypothetical protein
MTVTIRIIERSVGYAHFDTLKEALEWMEWECCGATKEITDDHFGALSVKETVDGRWMILSNGIQWGEGPHDASGCSSQTWETREDALRVIAEHLAF